MLLDVLLGAAGEAPGQVVVHVRGDGGERVVTHAELRDEALRVAGALLREGLAPGTPIPLVAERSEEFQPLFWGLVAAGLVPVPLAPDPRRVRPVWELLGRPPMVAGEPPVPEARVLSPAALLRGEMALDLPVRSPHDVAFLQFSSGSTGDPKGVELTHAAVEANLAQIRAAAAITADDVSVSWMPYFHDMGLIGTHLAPLAARIKQVKLGPLAFAKRPALWLETAARHRATVLTAANFALALVERRVPDDVIARLDLSSVRLMLVGAEPISPRVWRAFLAKTGLPPHVPQPVYGLAEATLAVTVPPPGTTAEPLVLDRRALAEGRVELTTPGPHAVELMDVGVPVPGCEVRVAGDDPVGPIQVRGPQVARGYHGGARFGDWLDTGDLGFLHEGRLCVTGRAKDVVFVNGATFHAADLEEVAAGAATGPAAVVGTTGLDGERVVVFVRAPAPAEVVGEVRRRVAEACGHDDVRVVAVPSTAFTRTTSGKLRRSVLRARFEAGEFTPAPRSRSDVEAAVTAIWADVLGVAEVGPHDRFAALGGSSLTAMQVLAAVEDRFGVTLRPSDVRDHDTVAALAAHLLTPPAAARPLMGRAGGSPVAITGMACRFPGADTPERFWERLEAGYDAVTPITRFDHPGHGGFLGDPALFDARFFGLSDDEAAATDPQARLLLELAHEALERAGYAGPRRHGRRIGVFAAAGESGYREILEAAHGPAGLPAEALTGNLPNLLAARVAHTLDLTGPALAVDTACSSALVALHLARRSLQQGECDLAVVAGVNLTLTPAGYRALGKTRALSPSGRCHAFGAAADGFVPGEGGAALVLARLDDAERAGDPVLAVVRGTAVNNDGRSLSLLAPNPLTQREVITRAYAEAGVDPAEVTYIEAHGTGTPVGDPIELRSLRHAFPTGTRLLGSVKTNVGHLLNAAAMPSLVKVVLALHHRRVPPSLHATPPADGLDGFTVPSEPVEWPAPRTAGINAFGFGGTNAHAILSEPPASSIEPTVHEGLTLLTLSAWSADALRRAAADLAAFLPGHEADVCASVAQARDDGPHRVAVVADGDLPARLATAEARVAGPRPRLVLLLPGQGAQGSGPDLYRHAPVFRQVVDEASDLVGPVGGRTLKDWCADPAAEIVRTDVAQPLLVVYGIALARQLRAWGVTPDAVAGHSVGELAAACVSGRLSLADAVTFAAERGRLMHDLCPPGAMAVVPDDTDLPPGVTVAAVNAPGRIVVAGSVAAVEPLGGRRLDVARAFHSPLMEPALAPLTEAAAKLTVSPPEIPLISTVTTEWNPSFDPAYLRDHAARPVRFADTIDRLIAEGYNTFLELGPSPALSGAVRAVSDAAATPVTTMAAGHEGGARALLETVGALWQRGLPIDRTAMDRGRTRVAVPTYPFERRRHWPSSRLLHRLVWHERPVDGRRVTVGGLAEALDAPRSTVLTSGDVTILVAGAPRRAESADALDAMHRDLTSALLKLDVKRLLIVTQDVHVDRPEQAVLEGLAAALAQETGTEIRVADLASREPVEQRMAAVEHEVADLTSRKPVEQRVPAVEHEVADLTSREPVEQRVAAVEHEIADLTSREPVEQRVAAVEHEVAARDYGVIAWRGGRRWERELEAVVAARRELPPDGVYLITGGAGGVGAVLARDLADRGRPTIVLAGRSARPPAGLLADLRSRGATVEYHAADVSREADVEALLARLPRLDGVFHAAGEVSPGALRSRSAEQVVAGMAAKTRGGHLLAEGLRRHRLSPVVCVAFSSVSSVLPGLAGGIGGYAAANAYLDALCRAEQGPWISVNFAAFAEVGLAARAGVTQGALEPSAALAALRAAIGSGGAQVVVADLAAVPEPASGPPSGEVRTVIRRLVGSALKRDDLGDDESFLSLGLDSLTAVDLVKRLEKELGRSLPVTLFFEFRTLRELSAHLDGGGAFPLTPTQVAFQTQQRLYPEISAYGYVRQTITGPLDTARLRAALEFLVDRHPMLRLRVDADGTQSAEPAGRLFFEVRDTDDLDALESDLRNRPFDLTREGPLRAVVARTPAETHLVIVVSHLAADGFSLNVLGDELWAVYTALSHGTTPVLPPLPTTFAEYAAASGPAGAGDLAYWTGVLENAPDLHLPYDGDPDGPPLDALQVALTPERSAALKAMAAAHGVSLFHLLLAAYVRCLARWSGGGGVAVNVARARREIRLAGVERLVGPLADTLPLVADVRPGESLPELAARLRDLWRDAERHASPTSVDLARLLPASGGPRTASPASFSFARFPATTDPGCPVDAVATAAGTASAATRLSLLCWESGGELRFSWNFPSRSFRRATVGRLAAEHLAELSVAESPGLAGRLRAQFRATPDAVAVDTGTARLTYGELDRRSAALANRLRGAGDLIGLMTEPGIDTVVGLVGIVRAGAGWVPLDAAHPEARRRDQLARCGVTTVVTDVSGEGSYDAPDVSADATAYVIFTSGSTGRPKGVPITWRSVENYLDWALATFGYHAGDRLAQTASICFDASVRQLLAPLLVGATVVTFTREEVRDPALLAGRLRDVTVWSSVPSLWARLLDEGPVEHRLRWIHVGGEALPPEHVRRWFDLYGPGARIANLYGPTESTVNTTCHVIDERPADDVTTIPIGRPIAGTFVEVDDSGELLIAGAGLTPGYLDDPGTAFVERDGVRWYRSGDRVRRDADGDLVFVGRLDAQVKVRGHRVEPGEVEAAFHTHPEVARAAVVLTGERLTAFVEPRPGRDPDPVALRRHLGATLPSYMIPARIEIVTALPQTPTGKIDRRELDGTPPATPTEELVAEVWRSLLEVPRVSREDDFFALGGDSILILRVFAQLAEHIGTLPRPTVVYEHGTLEALSRAIDEADPAPFVPAAADGPFPLTPAQRGFLLSDQAWLATLRVHGRVDRERFQHAVDACVARHGMLRTLFPGDVQQELPGSLRLPVIFEEAADPAASIAAERGRVFEPWAWPLLRLRLVTLNPEEHVLVVHAHHLIGDGYSAALLGRELLAAYDGIESPAPRSTFRDHVARLRPPGDEREAYLKPAVPPGPDRTTAFTVDATESRRAAAEAGTTLFVAVLAAYHRALTAFTGHDDLMLGVAVSGRDDAPPDAHLVFGPYAHAVPVRPAAGSLRAVAEEVTAARSANTGDIRAAQFFFTYLDFTALGPLEGRSLRLTWDLDGEIAPVGAQTFLSVRPTPEGDLRLVLRTAVAEADRFERLLRAELPPPADGRPLVSPVLSHAGSTTPASDLASIGQVRPGAEEAIPTPRAETAALDAALVGYLPPFEHVRALAPNATMTREDVRALLFPHGRPRLAEELDTPLGRSGFVCLPLFADELTHTPDLAARTADAVEHAAALGARTVSLAGMIPSLTGYGFDVARRTGVPVTTGHAATAVSVVLTVQKALAGRPIGDLTVAFVGLGSIGRSALGLMLTVAGRPRRLLLRDDAAPLENLHPDAESCDADQVYEADLIVAAVSGHDLVIDVDRLRPGTILVDDSFPHCFDVQKARARRDVTVVGGGLLSMPGIERRLTVDVPAPWLPGTIASCRLESLIPGLNPVHGLVDTGTALACRRAMTEAGVEAAPLHLAGEWV
ncbi:hybrid non-ribosomal peptide synthetase/type I polyketide synthase [Herbidospora daliensis]|uniref:hybrid non-ribosomal peptide synthetase/type I polyketide synthase n=1 Tax=Herbidospora daliensis TaxID=295585 RepID=UPI0007867CD6|nr:hybrid non-ribosomal peptide synthetase/type I polyketide synthase [Herbidospora daliensis]